MQPNQYSSRYLTEQELENLKAEVRRVHAGAFEGR